MVTHAPIPFIHRKEFVGLNMVGGWMESGFGLDMILDGKIPVPA